MLRKLWLDESGAVLTAELVLITTILVIGMVTGLTELRNAISSELAGVSGALRSLNQSYVVYPVVGSGGATSPSIYRDIVSPQQFNGGNTTEPDLQTRTGGNTCIQAVAFNAAPLVENNVYVSNNK